jgi:methionyl-tRNA synthetase
MNTKFYITAAIPYVNAIPHIGHALEFIQTDVIARYHRILDEDVLKLSGGDENAVKNVQAAEKAGEPVQQFVDKNTQSFFELSQKLNAAFDVWQKGSDTKHHFPASQKLWQLCAQNGDIYKQSYHGLYCVGCEAFYSPDELDQNGECPEHPGKKLDEIEETNYFFKLNQYQDQLIELIESDQLEIIPEFRKNEILSFLKSGLKDISISRSNQRAKNWGVPVPGDDTQRIYVWFDALNIYQSGIGFGYDEAKYRQWWPADLHVIGKGIIRFHAVYWPAFLLSAKLPLPKKIFVHEYFTVDGQKMSKTVGNVYNPVPILEKLGADPLRYYCLAKISPFSDGDFSQDKLISAYNSDLANGLGNLASRVATLCAKSGLDFIPDPASKLRQQVKEPLDNFRFDLALAAIWQKIGDVDAYIEQQKPWAQTGNELKATLTTCVAHIRQIAFELQPFLPDTAGKLLNHFHGPRIDKIQPLFPRIDKI